MYEYEELKKNALKFNATEDDINLLGEWFEKFGSSFWNGEYYKIDKNNSLYPIFKGIGELNELNEFEEFEITGYRIE